MAKTKTPVQESMPQAEDSSQAPIQLTITDLQAVSQVVDLASRRGAFQAAELAQVGAVYDKLAAFLKYVASVQPAEDGSKEGE